jgi:hypothetical protein
MKITITSDLVASKVNESSAATFTANFFSDAWVATAPTSARYRIDDPDSDIPILDWTTITPATSSSIAITGAQNAILDDCKRMERRQLTVQGDTGLDTQYQITKDWWVKNLTGQT